MTRSEEETIEFGRQLAAQLSPGSVVLLFGELGMGKTALVRGLADGFGASPDEVSSPTFVIINEYRGKVPVYHVDLYRISESEVEDLGLEDLQSSQSIVIVEWADRLPYRINGAVEVFFEDLGEDNRSLIVKKESLGDDLKFFKFK